ncbi:Rieske (2Fe-2S) protein [Hyphomicrobium sp. CS1GBMeth3]|uniref:QcrA and Rieske domain-containing protein n=1 Tax=Hyphomicrobium sp. CS1GBMeth3 TaxID=1892845 RepID=UPI000931E415|nr:Rieske (2Fe-2S) protein [Hyphomicrobium sp. CS1GBMeth3]
MSKVTRAGHTAGPESTGTVTVGRRIVIQGLAVSGCVAAAGGLLKSAAKADQGELAQSLKPGDRFALEVENGPLKPLRLEDIAPGTAILGAYPIDSETGLLRNETRLNMVNLARLSDVKPDTPAAAASGVVAFSAVCTHKGCSITSWNAEDSHWRCFCHMSEFDASDNGEPVAGPASDPLPMVFLAIDAEGYITASAEFSRTPGGTG